MRFALTICLLAGCSAPCLAQTELPASPTPPAVDAKPSPSTPLAAPAQQTAPAQQPDAAQQPAPAQGAVFPPPVTAAPVPPQDTGPLPDVRLSKNWQPDYPVNVNDGQGSTYIPMDSWMYPALDRLHALGYLDTAFLGLRPWTRLSVFHMLDRGGSPLGNADDGGSGNDEAEEIYLALMREVGPDLYFTGEHAELDTVYTRFLDIVKTPLNDSFHVGQTIINDYGRPYQSGVQNVTGASGRIEAGRATIYLRGEFQHAASAPGYSEALGEYLSDTIDNIPYQTGLHQATDPVGPIAGITNFRLLEANIGYHLFKHELTLGKTDHWLGPGKGGAFAWSTNADDIYSFQIDRIEPFYVPFLRRVTGPIRYDFFVGTLGGHTQPNHPWVHSEKISVHPTRDLEIGFQRTVIWGGKGHEPVTLHTFLRSFVDTNGTTNAIKFSSSDPGARFSAFDFTYRLPYLRNWLTLYLDSFAHDDVSPASAPRRAAIRPGLYLSHVPGVPKLDFRVEAASTDCVTSRCSGTPGAHGTFYYYEAVQQQGPTNKGFLYTDPIGRDAKGGQAWLTYNISPQEHLQLAYRNVKGDKNFLPIAVPNFTLGQTPPDPRVNAFVPGGTTQNEGTLDLVKRITPDLGIHLAVQVERWKAPVYEAGRHSDAAIWAEVIWYPHKEKQLGDDPKF